MLSRCVELTWRQHFCQSFEGAGAIFVRVRESVNRAVAPGQDAVFAGICKVGDRSGCADENQLPKFAELLDRLFKHILQALDSGDADTALQSSDWIGSEKRGAGGSGDASGSGESLAIERVSGHQHRRS